MNKKIRNKAIKALLQCADDHERGISTYTSELATGEVGDVADQAFRYVVGDVIGWSMSVSDRYRAAASLLMDGEPAEWPAEELVDWKRECEIVRACAASLDSDVEHWKTELEAERKRNAELTAEVTHWRRARDTAMEAGEVLRGHIQELESRLEVQVKETQMAHADWVKMRQERTGNDVLAPGPALSSQQMLDDAARALGWRTDFACGDSPITWDAVLVAVEQLRIAFAGEQERAKQLRTLLDAVTNQRDKLVARVVCSPAELEQLRERLENYKAECARLRQENLVLEGHRRSEALLADERLGLEAKLAEQAAELERLRVERDDFQTRLYDERDRIDNVLLPRIHEQTVELEQLRAHATLSTEQRNQLDEVARTATEDVASYRQHGAPTWDERRVGRMLARDAAIVELLPLALCQGLAQERDALLARQEEHLKLIAELTRETPCPGEYEECRSQRRALIAEVGTLRAVLAEYRTLDSVQPAGEASLPVTPETWAGQVRARVTAAADEREKLHPDALPVSAIQSSEIDK